MGLCKLLEERAEDGELCCEGCGMGAAQTISMRSILGRCYARTVKCCNTNGFAGHLESLRCVEMK